MGNQFHTYACGYSVAKYLNQELVLDVSDYASGYIHPYFLDKFQIGKHRMLFCPFLPEDRTVWWGFPIHAFDGLEMLVAEHAQFRTRESLFEYVKEEKNVCLLGSGGICCCSEEDRAELRTQLRLKNPSSTMARFKEQISGEYSVAVHIRRRDFLTEGRQNSDAYIKAAITFIRLYFPDAKFYFFSDDIQYVKNKFGIRAH